METRPLLRQGDPPKDPTERAEVSLSSESVTPAAPGTVEVVRTVRVAGGVSAPGHLGELTQVVPFELVDAVLAETGRIEQRLRDLPSRVGVYFLLALALSEHAGARLVFPVVRCDRVGVGPRRSG
jgi:hypothetical protein